MGPSPGYLHRYETRHRGIGMPGFPDQMATRDRVDAWELFLNSRNAGSPSRPTGGFQAQNRPLNLINTSPRSPDSMISPRSSYGRVRQNSEADSPVFDLTPTASGIKTNLERRNTFLGSPVPSIASLSRGASPRGACASGTVAPLSQTPPSAPHDGADSVIKMLRSFQIFLNIAKPGEIQDADKLKDAVRMVLRLGDTPPRTRSFTACYLRFPGSENQKKKIDQLYSRSRYLKSLYAKMESHGIIENPHLLGKTTLKKLFKLDDSVAREMDTEFAALRRILLAGR